MKSTEQMIYEMITENTGQHFLDSGGAYGRHWQRNSKRTLEDFKNDEQVSLKAHVYHHSDGTSSLDLDTTKSLFHHLTDALSYDEHMDTLFHRFVDQNVKTFYEYWDDERNSGYGDFSWEDAMNAFYKAVTKERKGRNYEWNSREFEREMYHGYTYNDENILSQDFVYHMMGAYVFIQTHNGCDARGGFSYPHLFQEKEGGALMRYSECTISCGEHWWDFQGGYEETEQDVYLLGGPNRKPVAQYIDADDEEYIEQADKVAIDLQAWKTQRAWFDNQDALPTLDKGNMPAPEMNLHGVILVKDGIAHCPVCGNPLYATSF